MKQECSINVGIALSHGCQRVQVCHKFSKLNVLLTRLAYITVIEVDMISESVGNMPCTYRYISPIPSPRNATKFEAWETYQFSFATLSAYGQIVGVRGLDNLSVQLIVKLHDPKVLGPIIFVQFPQIAIARATFHNSIVSTIIREAPEWALDDFWDIKTTSRIYLPALPSIDYQPVDVAIESTGVHRNIPDTWSVIATTTHLTLGAYVQLAGDTVVIYGRTMHGRVAGIFAVEKGWVQFAIVLRPDDACCAASDFFFLCAPIEITLLDPPTRHRIISESNALPSILMQTNIHRPVMHIAPPDPLKTWPF